MEKMQVFLTPDEMAEVAGGRWVNDDKPRLITGVRVNPERVLPGDIVFTTTPAQWGKGILDSTQPKILKKMQEKGAAAIVSTGPKAYELTGLPTLVVENPKVALEKIAVCSRDRFQGKTVLVTGTEGKTGFKLLLAHVLKPQCACHASKDSANLTVPVWCSMAGVNRETQVHICEVSVAQPKVGFTRSRYLRPNISVITEVGYSHVETHGGLDALIYDKASVSDGLVDGGCCVVNASCPQFDKVRECIFKRHYVPVYGFGEHPRSQSRVIEAQFVNQSWVCKADVRGKEVQYTIHAMGDHMPNAVAGVLLTVDLLGYDVFQAAKEVASFEPSETMGRLEQLTLHGHPFTFYDHSHRASPLNFRSALRDVSRIQVTGKRIAVLGSMLNLGDLSDASHKDLMTDIEKAHFDVIYTLGDPIKVIRPLLKKLPGVTLKGHAKDWKELIEPVSNEIGDGDLLFMKGNHRVWLKYLSAELREQAQREQEANDAR